MDVEEHCDSQHAVDGPPLHSLKPDIVCLDGHQFRINYGVPKEVTEQLEALFIQEPEVKYDSIPDHLKAYEVGIDVVAGQHGSVTASSQ